MFKIGVRLGVMITHGCRWRRLNKCDDDGRNLNQLFPLHLCQILLAPAIDAHSLTFRIVNV